MDREPTYEELAQRVRELEQEASKCHEAEESLRLTEQLACTVFDSLSANIAVLDDQGVIVKTNRAWREFGVANGIQMAPETIGVNYLALCHAAQGESTEGCRDVADRLRALLAGEIDEFALDYPCHSPDEKRWFYLLATRIRGPGPLRAVMSHENITALKLAEEALRDHESELKLQKKNLEEANVALKVLLRRREEDREELEERVLCNVKELIAPYMDKLKKTRLESQQAAYLEIIELNLAEIVSPFLRQLSSKYLHFTPQEIRVAGLVKDGKTSKEIAEILNISTNAVDFHRKNIRKKLGLTTKNQNLRSHLLSLA